MPSLRQRMTTYLRQLSFVHEPRGDESPRLHSLHAKGGNRPGAGHRTGAATASAAAAPSGCIVTQYLEGRLTSGGGSSASTTASAAATAAASATDATAIHHGKEPGDLPELMLLTGAIAPASTSDCPAPVTAACTGPDDGLCGVRRSRLHLSAGPEIDFIDTAQDADEALTVRPSTPPAQRTAGQRRLSAAARRPMAAPLADSNANEVSTRAAAKTAADTEATAGRTAGAKNVTINIVVNTIRPDIGGELPRTATAANNNQTTAVAVAKPEVAEEADEAVLMAPIFAAVPNWRLENDHAYGLSVSLYEQNYVTSERVGDPVADCYGLVVRGQSAVMAMADGVNWGNGARLAARSAIQGCLEYLDTAIFGCSAATAANASTRQVFISLLRSFWEAHSCILDVGGALSTLTACVVLPLAANAALGSAAGDRFVVCACNVGDSFGYVYSKRDGVREFTQGSHDIASMRDMRDALGALGPVQGNQPELGNLTLSMTVVEPGDIVFLTSDGISDNFDPVVGKFAEAKPPADAAAPVPTTQRAPTDVVPQLAPKRQNRSTSAIPRQATFAPSSVQQSASRTTKRPQLVSQKSEPLAGGNRCKPPRPSSASTAAAILSPQRQPAAPSATGSSNSSSRPKFLRSHTVIEPRSAVGRKLSTRLPQVSGAQRHALTLLRLEDLLCYGINGTRHPCPSARKLCHLLVDFARMITAARRGMLEQRDLYFRQTVDPVSKERLEVQLTQLQQRAARKRCVEGAMFAQLPGKLDHASVVAFTVERLAGGGGGGGGDGGGRQPEAVVGRQAMRVETDF